MSFLLKLKDKTSLRILITINLVNLRVDWLYILGIVCTAGVNAFP